MPHAAKPRYKQRVHGFAALDDKRKIAGAVAHSARREGDGGAGSTELHLVNLSEVSS